jgi:hypothetical protein
MNKTLCMVLCVAAAFAAYAAQDTDITPREVKDPKKLETWLQTNAADAESRVAALEAGDWSGGATLSVSNSSNAGAATITLQSDKGDDAGDKFGIVAQDGGTLAFQSDASVKGTLATKASMSSVGALTVTALSTGTGEATVDGKYAVVGGDATTGLMVLKGAVTSGTNATETVTFGTVFGAAPIVMCTYTEDPGDVRPIYVTSVTASNFVANITADKNFGYIAVGTRP